MFPKRVKSPTLKQLSNRSEVNANKKLPCIEGDRLEDKSQDPLEESSSQERRRFVHRRFELTAMMSFLFAKKKSSAELLRENKRKLDRSIREIEKETKGLQAQETKLVAEIKKTAKHGQVAAAKILAKDLIRTRDHVSKLYALKSQLRRTSLRIMTLKYTQATRAVEQIMQKFERQNEKIEMESEAMGDATDEASEGEETEELVNQVLDEIGIVPNAELINVASAEAETSGSEDGGIDGELQARLDNLRKSC